MKEVSILGQNPILIREMRNPVLLTSYDRMVVTESPTARLIAERAPDEIKTVFNSKLCSRTLVIASHIPGIIDSYEPEDKDIIVVYRSKLLTLRRLMITWEPLGHWLTLDINVIESPDNMVVQITEDLDFYIFEK
jgi:hypothetical protein